MPLSRGSLPFRDQTCALMSPALVGGFFMTSAMWETQKVIRPADKVSRLGSPGSVPVPEEFCKKDLYQSAPAARMLCNKRPRRQ